MLEAMLGLPTAHVQSLGRSSLLPSTLALSNNDNIMIVKIQCIMAKSWFTSNVFIL